MTTHTRRAFWLAAVCLLLLPFMVLIATGYSETDWYAPDGGGHGLSGALRAVWAEAGLSAPGPEHALLRLRLIRALAALAVGGTLALAGALTQGIFRNPMAEPSLLGVSSGAAIGAFAGIALLGGYGPDGLNGTGLALPAKLGLIPFLAFLGALATVFSVYRLAVRQGRLSIAILLLTGLAVNSLMGSLLATLQTLLLKDWQISRAFLAWGFGSLDDKSPWDLAVAYGGAAIALASIPRIALDLDLLAGGEEDAAALGANPGRIKAVVLSIAALSTAAAVCVAGPVAFIGLLVPQIVRLLTGPHHRTLLPVSFLAGAVLLTGVVVLQHALSPALGAWADASGHPALANLFERLTALQPGVLTSLLGAPCFLFLLFKQERIA